MGAESQSTPFTRTHPVERVPPFRPHVRCFAALRAPSPTRGEGKNKNQSFVAVCIYACFGA